MKKATHRKQALMIAIFLLAFTLSLFSFGTTPAAAGDVAGVSTHLFLTVLRDYDHDASFSVTYTDALGTHTKPYHAGMEVTAWSPVTITCTNHHVHDWSIDADVQEATIVGVGGITYPGGTGITALRGFSNAHDHRHLIVDVLIVHLIPQQGIHPAAVGLRQAEIVVRRFFHAALAAAGRTGCNAALLGDLSLFALRSFVERDEIFFVGHVTTSLAVKSKSRPDGRLGIFKKRPAGAFRLLVGKGDPLCQPGSTKPAGLKGVDLSCGLRHFKF